MATDNATAPAQPVDPEKAAEIRKLLEATGTLKIMNQVMDQMIESSKKTNPEIPEVFWVRFKSKNNLDDLMDKLVPVYDKYYSLDDLKAINAFYATPAGQHMVSSLPFIMKDSMAIGQEWGTAMGEKIEKEMKEEQAKGK
jgi:hypothetical protein